MLRPPKSSSTVYLGIDPGKSGGIAVLSGYSVVLYKMPDSESDIAEILTAYSRVPGYRAMIEKVSSSPQMGVTSAFTFGRGYGFLRGCLTSLRISFQEVPPQTWQKALSIPQRKKTESQPQFKRRLVDFAKRLFPGDAKQINLSTADALLIAEYCRRVNNG